MEPPAAASSSSPPYTLQTHPAAKKRTVVIESLEDICAGSIAGVVGKYIEYPFDTVKVRLQSQPDGRPLRYAGPLDCFRQSIRAEGVIDGLYRGITAPLVGAALENSTMFFFERMGRELVYAVGGMPAEPADQPQKRPLPLAALYLTGAFAGILTSFVLTPIELVKCKIQVPAVAAVAAGTAAAALGAAPPSLPPLRPLAVIRDVYRHEGLLAFWHGQLGTLIREGGGGAAWFGAKETVTQLFRAHNARRRASAPASVPASDPAPAPPPPPDPLQPLPLWQQAVAGAAGGLSYNFLFFPADTIKSRMQTAAIGGRGEAARRRSFWSEGAVLWRQYGLRGMYRGCGITCLRSAPSSAFIFIVYDGLKVQMQRQQQWP